MHEPAAALVQLNQWIPAHSEEYNIDDALNMRCRARALLGSELSEALSDCNTALKAKQTAARYDSRGLVNLRMGNSTKRSKITTKRFADRPKERMGRCLDVESPASVGASNQAGRADIAAAKAISSSIEAEAARYGVRP